MVGLTEQQGKALDLGKHISVTANAGSGKTRVLVERYVRAVLEGADVEQILCLTFTEKAALELRQKIVDRIASEFTRGDETPDRLSRLRRAREKMLEANISTIHSFCSQVLREFPVEAGIDANFKVLEDFDAASLKEEACDEAVRGALSEERTAKTSPGAVHDFLVRIGYRRTLALLGSLLDSREKIEHISVTGKRVVLDEAAVREHWTNLSRAALDIVTDCVDIPSGKDLGPAVSGLERLMQEGASALDVLLEGLQSLLSKVLTKEGTVRKALRLRNQTLASSSDALSILQTAYAPLKHFSPGTRGGRAADYLHLIGVVMDLYRRALENYSRRKTTMSALDFDDLQILTMRLLHSDEAVRGMLVSRFGHIMLDEFQDTNFLQYDIFVSLLDGYAGNARLFVVGDPKQSIYRFRNAQVEVSRKTQEDLSRRTDGTTVSLSESFRMNPGLAAFSNAVFPAVMTGKNPLASAGLPSAAQVEYSALIPRRPGGTGDPVELFVPSEGSGEEDADAGTNGESEGPDRNELQARFAAARIRKMVGSKEKIRDVRNSEQLREIGYGDIAILLRSRAKLPLLEQSLTDYGIPYVVSAGIGFYSAQEIFDLTNYLTFLLDNNSDVDLLTVLRSPFFGISENELFEMSSRGGGTLFTKLRSFASSDEAGEEVKYALFVLDDEIALAQRLTIPQLLNRILERTGWLAAYRLSPTGEQRLANLRKLLSIAREFEGRGFNNLYDFVERVKYLKDTAREGQAPVEEAVDAVKIMTVHAAKGLEFPVVIVPFCDSRAKRDGGLIVNDNIGVLPIMSNEFPPELALYGRLESLSEQAETARLFYVACTRAMDKLILTTAPKRKEDSPGIGSFADILAKSVDLSAPAGKRIELPGVGLIVHAVVPAVGAAARADEEETPNAGEILLEPIPADIDGEMYSATLLQTFRLCPTKYFLRYRLGMPVPGERPNAAQESDYGDGVLSTVKGELTHAVMEEAVTSRKMDDATLTVIAGKVVSSELGNAVSDADREELVGLVLSYARNASSTLLRIMPEGDVFAEQTLTRRFGPDFLTGTLDLLVRDEKGFHIFDYKTNKLDRSAEEIYRDYEIQMKLYASLCRSLIPEQKEFDVTLIFAREKGKYLTKVYSSGELDEFERGLSRIIGDIKNIETPRGLFPTGTSGSLPTKTPHCPECEYFTGQPAKRCLLDRR